MPNSESPTEYLFVKATTMLTDTKFTSDGLIKDDSSEVKLNDNDRSVEGDFRWIECCTDGFAAGGFQDTSGNFDVQITFKNIKGTSFINKIFLETYDKGRTKLAENLDFNGSDGDVVTLGFRGKLNT
jgi:hypothetical protein